jgi:hypothetical protein
MHYFDAEAWCKSSISKKKNTLKIGQVCATSRKKIHTTETKINTFTALFYRF